MNIVEFIELLEMQLGGSLVDVELTDVDYSTAFQLAKRTYLQRANHNHLRDFYVLAVKSGVQSYVLPSNVISITRIIRPSGGFSSKNIFHVGFVSDMYKSMGSASGSLIEYELMRNEIEYINRYAANYVQFNYNRFRNTLKIVNLPKVDEKWVVDCFLSMEDEELMEIPWIQDWALAECKQMLGRAYSKFSNISGPTGDFSLDGRELIQESREDKDRLLEDISDYVDGEPVGGAIFLG